MIKNWSELEVIKLITKTAHGKPGEVVTGIGDDCAVINTVSNQQLLVTTDMLVEDIHFDLAYHPPFELGRKSIGVNISDIAAMGGEPKYVFTSLCLPDHLENAWISQWIAGVNSMASQFNCFWAGGDTVRGTNLTINVTVLGVVHPDQTILRKTAGIDQSVFVSGELGSAAAGLKIYQHWRDTELFDLPISSPFKKRHLEPLPDVRCGCLLAENGLATAMQDISDGIATDLTHICKASNIGAVIEEKLLPCHPDLPQIAEQIGCRPISLMISGGEDYHLVFTVDRSREEELQDLMSEKNIMIHRIGKTIEGKGLFLRTKKGVEDISYGGFEH